ncbi:MAG TPA: hypothetical protein VMW10_10645 [Alphaproteobacteria bacterium]|nr:hypothetical protein [Alphaproteobacteria bacterium]
MANLHRLASDYGLSRIYSEGWIKDILKSGDAIYVEGKLTYQHKTGKTHRARIVPHIVIFDYEGKVEHLRSNQNASKSESFIPNTHERALTCS